ncbi:hypothetical protein MAPG_03886 [Magnaporthiopsis poae ATCC 64411]|uniref:25S rRNA (Uridine(2843)-N(3))-methyltransferase n=1 Tax=Magnaporthiopsis poae (strain ATCC 64411 / 73-15) TaxID=644358 RepID=A0A0C4DV86_MAGP6|nr:hypothetical protein MAPG_03886 [Magnaporthiopsis poae ATCC 64411]
MAKKQPGKRASPSHAKPQSNRKQTGTGHGKPDPSLTAAGDRTAADKDNSPAALGTPDQKRILDVFADVFAAELTSDAFAATLQAIKQALFERDFDAAFGAEANLRVYAARYSPTRALCYADALSGIAAAAHLDGLLLPPSGDNHGGGGGELKALAIGGGAAEVAAFAAFLRRRPGATASGSVVLLDSGPWGAVVDSLAAGLTTAPTLSKYASAEIKASNRALIDPERFKAVFVRVDALALDVDGYGALIPSSSPCLVTLLFTLNELLTAGGIGKTTAFLLNLSAGLPSGSLLLVIDSPGSYSETAVGKDSKRYPMSWLLDKVLLSTAEDCEWTKLESHESLWFRLPTGLRYPIPLENMRYQLHLYRVTKPKPTSSKRE